MRILYSYLRCYWRLVGLALALATVSQMFLFLDPLILRYLVDRYAVPYAQYTPAEFLRGVAFLLLAAVGAALIARMTRNMQDYVLSIVSTRVGANLYSDGIRHSLQLPYAVFEDQRSGETLGKLQKVRTDVEKFVAAAVTTLFAALFGVAFVTIYAFTLHWVIAVSFFSTMGLLVVLSSRFSQRIKKLQKTIVAETAVLSGSTTESLRNIELVRSLGLGRQEIGRLNSLTEGIVRLELRKARTVRLLTFLQAMSVVSMRACLMFLMVYFIYSRRITVGQWLSLSFYWAYIFGPLQELGTALSTFRETEGSLENFKAIVSTPVETNPASPVPLGRLESLAFDDVTFAYQDVPALSANCFGVRRGNNRLRWTVGIGKDNAGEANGRSLFASKGTHSVQRQVGNGRRSR
jgi:ATP-binding cassette subfamily B protein